MVWQGNRSLLGVGPIGHSLFGGFGILKPFTIAPIANPGPGPLGVGPVGHYLLRDTAISTL